MPIEARGATRILDAAVSHLECVAENEDVAGNLMCALGAIMRAALELDTADVPEDAVIRTVAALQGAREPATAHFGDYPLPSTTDLGLRSAGGIVRTFGAPREAWSDFTRDNYDGWVDCTLILLAEAEAATRWRRVKARAEAQIAGRAVAPASPALH